MAGPAMFLLAIFLIAPFMLAFVLSFTEPAPDLAQPDRVRRHSTTTSAC